MMNGANVYKGESSFISPQAYVSNSIIWDDAQIADGAKLNRTILADGVKINSGDTYENAAIVLAAMLENVEVPEKALKGYREGKNFIVPFGQ
jgi:NDP-sugar pyrophosphorylase family protein